MATDAKLPISSWPEEYINFLINSTHIAPMMEGVTAVAAVGFRCLPDGFVYVILDGTQRTPVLVARDRFVFPTGLSWGGKLAWTRRQVAEILEAHHVNSAGMKSPEPIAKTKSLLRSEVEGVVKETVYARLGLECVSRVKVQLAADISGFSDKPRYLSRVLTLRNLGDLKTDILQEAALAALPELPKE